MCRFCVAISHNASSVYPKRGLNETKTEETRMLRAGSGVPVVRQAKDEVKPRVSKDGTVQRAGDSRRQGVGEGMTGRNARMPKRGWSCQASHRHSPSGEERQRVVGGRLAPSTQGHVKKRPLPFQPPTLRLPIHPSIYRYVHTW